MRQGLAEKVEQHLAGLAEALAELSENGSVIERARAAAFYDRHVDQESTASRLNRRAVILGLALWFGIQPPILEPAPQDDFVAREAAAIGAVLGDA